MKILAFTASPNKDGNTNRLLKFFLEELEGEVKIIDAYKAYVKPCTDCKYCYKHRAKCAIDDDMTDIYKSMEESDVIIVASPVYFSGFPAPMKSIIDRTQIYWSEKFILNVKREKNKSGVLLLTAGSNAKDLSLLMNGASKHFFHAIGCKGVQKIEAFNMDNRFIKKNEELLKKITKITQKLKNKID